QHLLPAAFVELEVRHHRVRRLLIVVEHIVAAHGADLGWILHAQQPARRVHLVHALIADIAVAVIPEPVKVVVEAITRELAVGRGGAAPGRSARLPARAPPPCGRSCCAPCNTVRARDTYPRSHRPASASPPLAWSPTTGRWCRAVPCGCSDVPPPAVAALRR